MLNTAGNLDGKIKILVNDELVLSLEDVNFREGKENRKILIIYKYKIKFKHHLSILTKVDTIKIYGAHYSTFFGGSSSTWAPLKDEYAQFRNFEFSEYLPSGLPANSASKHCDRI